MNTFFIILFLGTVAIFWLTWADEHQKRLDAQARLNTAYKALSPCNKTDDSKRQLLQYALASEVSE
ncbi:hypothetical protein [Methylobacter sp. YRD-M1]|uniref:hypothetical protein n=1 Tax=Methylobacter sp. YRD-M1 TaxID=2911520 RepID=UPI00227CE87B|nr:hypothetical protein [Methylobacter sp. YRD-M1]WAK01842.1 hypothetical protein LZ558_18815 [Methylobacter sp. YRD-M1]